MRLARILFIVVFGLAFIIGLFGWIKSARADNVLTEPGVPQSEHLLTRNMLAFFYCAYADDILFVMMGMNQNFIIGVAVAALAALVVAAFVWVGGSATVESGISELQIQEFTAGMRAKVVAEVGQPIEGFEPSMFMQAYPGLKAQDFHTVDATIGLYRYQGGKLVYDLGGEQETSSAARAVTDQGMRQLLLNVATRLQISLDSKDAVAAILAKLAGGGASSTPQTPERPSGSEAGITTTLTGTIACLPHKGGPITTLECAFGLKTDNGRYYALKNLSEIAPHIADTTIRVRVMGALSEIDENEKYDIDGVITIMTITEL
ncbi:MAG: hypothetical protein AAB449_03250 [Patescibacteria group bacterium]